MYGLSSRKSLTQRKIQWGPPSDTKSKDSGPSETPSPKAPASTADLNFLPSTSGTTDKPPKQPQNVVINDRMIEMSAQQSADQEHHWDKVESIHQQMTLLIQRWDTIDQHGIELSQRIIGLEHQMNTMYEVIGGVNSTLARIESILTLVPYQNSDPHEQGPEPSDVGNYVPFFMDQTSMGRDNKTSLVGTHLEMVVEILTIPTQDSLIYPFGSATNMPTFEPQTLQLTLTDADDLTGIIEGVFRQDKDGVYVIEITDPGSILTSTLPVKISGMTELQAVHS